MTGRRVTDQQKLALDHARHLAEHGVPIFLAPSDGRSKLGFRLPARWEQTTPDPLALEAWRPGMAVCAVMGQLVDAVDVDVHKGGDASLAELRRANEMPKSYGRQATPSGGTHDLVASLGVASKDNLLAGLDVKAGTPEGGRGFVFLAPTERPSKVTGDVTAYRWLTAPDVTELAIVGADDTGAALAERIRASRRRKERDPAPYSGPSYDDLTEGERAMADAEVERVVTWWRGNFAEAVNWPDGHSDEFDRGWEKLARDFAWRLAVLAVTPWAGLDEDVARDLYDEVLPDELAGDENCRGKWHDGLVAKAELQPVAPPPWADLAAAGVSGADSVDVTNTADAFDWLRTEVGRGALAGLFRRGRDIVHTPRIGEHGYLAPTGTDSDGPAQVRRVGPVELAARVDTRYRVFKVGRQVARASFPIDTANRAASVVDELPNLRALHGVTHTPVIRPDGSILDVPGFDPATGLLYLPDVGLEVPVVPERPSQADVTRAGKLLLGMVAEFPFVTVHDRANYLGALLTPLLRPVIAPPYKLMAIGAPQRGSGKSLLAALLREIHGGVFKSEFPTSPDELRKLITSTLDTTSAPVIQIDNVRGVLSSSVLDGLLTSATWSDRLLGKSELLMDLPNDRLWVVTGNNLKIGGDLGRRTLWVTINAKVPEPEKRTDFRIADLEGWARANRAELLHALLVLVRAWVVAGRPVGELPTSDSFGPWVAALRGILAHADLGMTVGVVGHADSIKHDADPEEAEWATFLAAALAAFGTESWTARYLLGRALPGNYEDLDDASTYMRTEDLPGDIAEKLYGSGVAAAKSLGRWLGFREGRWAGGLSVESAGTDRRGSTLWRIAKA